MIERINSADVTPLYHQIKIAIMKKYKDMPRGTRIPSEKELMVQFKVSRGTIQRAINELTRQGFLYRIQGKGTFVHQPRVETEGIALLSFTEQIKKHGYETKAKILRFEVTEPKPVVQKALELGPGDTVYLIERIRYIECDPMAVVVSHIPCKIVGGLTVEDVSYSVYNALRRVGYGPVKARDVFRVQNADYHIAQQLNCAENSAVFVSERTAYAENNTPVEYVEGVIKGQDYVLTIEPYCDKTGSEAYFRYDK